MSGDPASLLRARDGVYAADLLIAGVAWLDVLTWLDAREVDLDGLCEGLGLHPRPADVLCTLLCAMGLLRRDGQTLRPTTLAREHLVEGAPRDLRPYYASLRERPICLEMRDVLRTGEPASWSSSSADEDWAGRLDDPAFAESFTAAMDARAAVLAPAMAEALDDVEATRLLDVAGGSGVYAAALVERRGDLRATVLERPPVDVVARTLRGPDVEVVAADMFADPFPSGHDLHLFSHVLHDWDAERVKQLLEASFAALEPGGALVDHDVHVGRDKCGPLAAAEYSALLVHSTYGKCWSMGELEGMLSDAGFEDVTTTDTVADRSLVMARRPG